MLAAPPYKDSPSQESLNFDVKDLSTQDKKELFDSDVSDTDTEVPVSLHSFNPTKSLLVNSTGVGVIRFPYPYNRELQIPVTTPSGELVYTSLRDSKHSGNAILSAPGRGDLIVSQYRFGPGREPKLEFVDRPEGTKEVLVSGKWTSRSQIFTYASVPIQFEWRYGRELVDVEANAPASPDGKKPKKQLVLALEVAGKDKADVKRIAMLVRNEETRTTGTKRCYAGNGGELRMDELAAKSLGIPEELLIATCIMMLKKEVDRRRSCQWVMIMGAMSAGGS